VPADRRSGYWLRILATTSAAALTVTLLAQLFGSRDTFGRHLAVALIHANCIGLLAALVLPRVGRRIDRARTTARMAVLVAVLTGLAAVGSLLAGGIVTLLGIFPPARALASVWDGLRVSMVITLVFGTSMALYETMRSRLEATTLELRTQELERERAEKLATEARLASLESRLQPHFLFNTLNSISALIQDDPARAERMVERLAALLRFALDATGRSTVPLGEELRIVTDYLEIEQARLGDRLRYVIAVPSELEAVPVPPLALQTLVENSVKHVATPRRAGATIRIEVHADERGVRLAVWDDGPGVRLDGAATAGHGLDNLRGRLAALYGATARLDAATRAGGGVVTIELPPGPGQPAARP
jgi:two-component system sensor histidine kinase AlgZ